MTVWISAHAGRLEPMQAAKQTMARTADFTEISFNRVGRRLSIFVPIPKKV
jgi:hypothetical protein